MRLKPHLVLASDAPIRITTQTAKPISTTKSVVKRGEEKYRSMVVLPVRPAAGELHGGQE
jgi:hypothetical protein